MERRRFLAAVGASFTAAGCLSRGSTPRSTDPGTSDPGSTDTPPSSGEREPTVTGTPGPTTPPHPDGFVLGRTTGDVNPHELRVTNDGDVPRTVDLRIGDAETGETLLDRSYALASGDETTGILRGPATYEVRVTLPAAGTQHVTTVDYFDTCNDYGTHVTIDPDGSVSSHGFTTHAVCDESPSETADRTPTPSPEGFALGETTGEFNPHGLTVHNEGDTGRTVDLTVSDAESGETLLDRSYSLDADERISGELRALGVYEVRVAVPEVDTDHVTTIDLFDTCNAYGTTVTVAADGSLSSETVTTLAACPPSGTAPSEGFALGETTGDVNPHDLTVRNDAAVGLSVAVRIADADTDETLLAGTYALGSGEAIEGELRGPAAYDVRVEAMEAGTKYATTVEYFDTCNDYGTTVTIAPDGSISSETVTTDVYCGSESDEE